MTMEGRKWALFPKFHLLLVLLDLNLWSQKRGDGHWQGRSKTGYPTSHLARAPVLSRGLCSVFLCSKSHKEASFSQKSPSLAAVSQETYLQPPCVLSLTILSVIILSMIIHHTCPEAEEKLAEEKWEEWDGLLQSQKAGWSKTWKVRNDSLW